MTKIHACPFCGSSSSQLFEIDLDRWAIACANCGAIGPTACSAYEAGQLWRVKGDDAEPAAGTASTTVSA